MPRPVHLHFKMMRKSEHKNSEPMKLGNKEWWYVRQLNNFARQPSKQPGEHGKAWQVVCVKLSILNP